MPAVRQELRPDLGQFLSRLIDLQHRPNLATHGGNAAQSKRFVGLSLGEQNGAISPPGTSSDPRFHLAKCLRQPTRHVALLKKEEPALLGLTHLNIEKRHEPA